jgi:ubiquinone/menaquinone biosynthesis C-methylase UbiE
MLQALSQTIAVSAIGCNRGAAGANIRVMNPREAPRPTGEQFLRNPQAFARMSALMSSSADAKFLHYLVSISGVARTDRVLDVACGPGACARAFAGRCRHVVGLDSSPDLIAEARIEAARSGAGNAEFVVGEVERMCFRDGAFDAAVCRFAFHHFTNPARVFAEMARAVAPRGWMVVVDVTASEDPAKAAAHNELERLCDPMHVRMLAASEFERIFAAAGFSVAMKIARQSTSTVEEWACFGDPPRENLPVIRAMLEDAVDDDRPGLALQRDADTIRLMHTSVSFVLERSARKSSRPRKRPDGRPG